MSRSSPLLPTLTNNVDDIQDEEEQMLPTLTNNVDDIQDPGAGPLIRIPGCCPPTSVYLYSKL